jgi:hypothetical protein
MKRLKTSVLNAEKVAIIITASMGDLNMIVPFVKEAN